MQSSLKITTQKRIRRAGFSMTELAIVMAIMGIILGALWSLVAVVRENIKRDETLEQLTVIVDNIRKTIHLYKGDEPFELPLEFRTRLHQTLRQHWKSKPS